MNEKIRPFLQIKQIYLNRLILWIFCFKRIKSGYLSNPALQEISISHHFVPVYCHFEPPAGDFISSE